MEEFALEYIEIQDQYNGDIENKKDIESKSL